MTDHDLEPCPFCGSHAELVDGRAAWYVRCTGCDVVVIVRRVPEEDVEATTDAEWESVERDAVMKWNRRYATIPKNSNP